MKKIFLFFLFFTSSVSSFYADIPEVPSNYVYFQKVEGGYELYIKKPQGVESIILTESQRDPAFKVTTYGLRALKVTPINGNEKRILDGREVVFKDATCYLIDSTTEYIEGVGDCFRFFLTEEVVFGYSWSRRGTLKIAPGVQINLRLFAKKYGDYTGPFRDQWIILALVSLPAVEETTNIATELAKSDSTIVLLHTSETNKPSSVKNDNLPSDDLIKKIQTIDNWLNTFEGQPITPLANASNLKLIIISSQTAFPFFKITKQEYKSGKVLKDNEETAWQKIVISDGRNTGYWIYRLAKDGSICSISQYAADDVLLYYYQLNFNNKGVSFEKYNNQGKLIKTSPEER